MEKLKAFLHSEWSVLRVLITLFTKRMAQHGTAVILDIWATSMIHGLQMKSLILYVVDNINHFVSINFNIIVNRI
ncbi:hypothetical protein DDN75_17015 [Vibrio cholerae]|nr:hypothetical protein [Vibrio cholerae]